MTKEIMILSAYFLDIILGDPYFIPHPIRFIGTLIKKLEEKLYKLKDKKMAGLIILLLTVLIVFSITKLLCKFSIYIELVLIYTILATKCLAKEGFKIYKTLKSGNLEKARKEISYLVSRNTDDLSEEEVIRACVETISENIVDAVIAPLFYIFIGGASLGMAYKAVSTLDSMIGYKNDKYKDFGFFSAKADDVLNFIPARIAGFLILPFTALLCGYNFKNSFKIVKRDRLNHPSPNSAHSEAAVAGALGIQLGGKTKYFGKLYDKKTIGDKLKNFDMEDILKSINILYLSSFISLITVLIITYIS